MANHSTVYRQLTELQSTLKELVQRDPEQEVQGVAMRAMDAVLREAKQFVGDRDPVIAEISDVVSPETVAAGEPVRAADMLIVVSILKARIGRPPMTIGIA